MIYHPYLLSTFIIVLNYGGKWIKKTKSKLKYLKTEQYKNHFQKTFWSNFAILCICKTAFLWAILNIIKNLQNLSLL